MTITEIKMVIEKIYNDRVINKQETVYDPDKFRKFCISAGAKKVFDTILGLITSFRLSADCTCLNKKGLIHLFTTCATVSTKHAILFKLTMPCISNKS